MTILTTQGSIVKTQDDNSTKFVGYCFDIIKEHSVSAQSNITSNWLENGSFITDHIVNQPISISLKGISGELVFKHNNTIMPNEIKQGLTYSDKLNTLSVLLPEVDNITQLYKNATNYVNASVQRYKNVYDKLAMHSDEKNAAIKSVSVANNLTKIQQIYSNLDRMRMNKIAFIVETPFKTFKNMYIQSLSFQQSEDLHIVDIDISFTQVNFASTKKTSADKNVLAKYSELQRAETENNGSQTGVKT